MKQQYGFATRTIHSGQEPEPATGAIMTPIFATSTFVQASPGINKGFEYSRSGNPTRKALETCIADLEEGAQGYAFSSGLAASATILELLEAGSHVIVIDDTYGGTYRMFDKVKKISTNMSVSSVDMTDLKILENAFQDNTRMVWVESPSNPLLKIVDLQAIAAISHAHNTICVCDNTFATPYLQKPLTLGFDIVVHSATKYLNGHSDVIAGLAVARERSALADRLAFLQNAIGSVLSPFDSFLVLRGLKTLSLRMDAHVKNAIAIADYLQGHARVERVLYPGLSSHPQFELAKRQMRYPGGMITFYLKCGMEGSKRFLERCRLFSLAESLGGVESLIEHPAIMTHASIPRETRQRIGISDNLVRISVGTEDVADLIDDLSFALE